jgi:hypothetical protein
VACGNQEPGRMVTKWNLNEPEETLSLHPETADQAVSDQAGN